MNRLKQVLKQQGRTQKWFAEQMDKTENTISLWVQNKVDVALKDLYKAADVLEVDVTDLLEKKENIKRD